MRHRSSILISDYNIRSNVPNLPAQVAPGLPSASVYTSVMRASRAEINRLVAPFQSRLDNKCVNIDTLQFTFQTIINL